MPAELNCSQLVAREGLEQKGLSDVPDEPGLVARTLGPCARVQPSPSEGGERKVVDMANERCFVTRNVLLAALAVGLSLLTPAAAWAQAANACDLNQDGVVNVLDIQLATSMALGSAPCTAQVVGVGVCNIVLIQRITNAVLTGNCITDVPIAHSVSLSWTASTSSNVTGYNVYRGTQASGPYTKLTSSSMVAVSFTDSAVQAGQTYYYAVTAVDNNNNESAYSNQAQAVVPSP
jgi:hypothetical protein